MSGRSTAPISTAASVQADGTPPRVWDHIADLDGNEGFDVSVVAALASGLTVAIQFTNNCKPR